MVQKFILVIFYLTKNYMKIFQFIIVHKTPTGPKSLCIRFHKIYRFIIALDGKNKHLILFDYGLFNIRLNIL